MSEFSTPATFSYIDYTANDHSPAAAFFGEDTAGFTIQAIIENIPKISPITGESAFCSLVVSFGDPNFGSRIGKRVTFGPDQDHDIPDDGVLVAAVTVGYFGSDNFGIVGGTLVNIPSGLATGTIAGYFDPGNLPIQTYLGELILFASESIPSQGGGGEPPLTERPEDLKVKEAIEVDEDIVEITFEFDYENGEEENPDHFDIIGKTEGGFDLLFEGNIPWVNGVTHYVSVTNQFNLAALSVARTYWVIAVGSAGETSPGSNIISFPASPTMQDMLDLVNFTPPVEEQVSPLAMVGSPSGIYTLVANQRHDTLYSREPFNIVSEDVKIPTPFAKTAFLP